MGRDAAPRRPDLASAPGHQDDHFLSLRRKVGRKRQPSREDVFQHAYALKTAGGEVINGSVDFEPPVIADRELITGQNPRSDHPIAAKLIEALAHCEGRAAALSQADVDKESLKLRV